MPRHAGRRREGVAAVTGASGGGGGLQASPAGAGPSADPARRGLPLAQETLVTWPELMSPGRALEGLRVELAARGLATVGMTVTRLQGMLTLAEGPGVGRSAEHTSELQ